MSEEQENPNKHAILESLSRRDYFFDVQERKNGLVVLVNKQYEKSFIAKVIKNKCSRQDIYVRVVQSVAQYLDFCRNYVDSCSTEEFKQTRQKVRQSLEAKFGGSGIFYPAVKVMEKGRSVTTLDFVHKQDRSLSLFKIAASKRKERRKRISIKNAANFFKRYFMRDFDKMQGYVLFCENDSVDYQLVHEYKPLVKTVIRRRR